MLVRGIDIGNKDKIGIWGILNVTPDSFYDGNARKALDEHLRHCEQMIEEGASVIDIGGESTRPGAQKVSADEEAARVLPVIEAIRSRMDVVISLDSYKAEVMREGIKAGADIANDVTGLLGDPDMAGVVAEAGVPVCIMHTGPHDNMIQDNLDLIANAENHGIARDKLILDPGLGFGKDTHGNLVAMAKLNELTALGLPVLLGASRKSFIGNTLDLPVEERLNGTIATSVLGVNAGVTFIRVHDVAANVQAIRLTEAIRDSVR
ncbi:MAG: dihydropteroate synthase [Lachnospiraceae bacterium]|nr:dihydropteroate synthase [Lachnospiraceae bacterium]